MLQIKAYSKFMSTIKLAMLFAAHTFEFRQIFQQNVAMKKSEAPNRILTFFYLPREKFTAP
jgi:hypothetical protein